MSDPPVERAGVLDLVIGCKAAMVCEVVVRAWADVEVDEDDVGRWVRCGYWSMFVFSLFS